MGNTNGARGQFFAAAAIHATPRRTVAAMLVVVAVEHNDCDARQTALDFGGETSRSTSQRAERPSAQSGVHVIDCDALEIVDDGAALALATRGAA